MGSVKICHISQDLVFRSHLRTLSVVPAIKKICILLFYEFHNYILLFFSMFFIYFTFLIGCLDLATWAFSRVSSVGFTGILFNLTPGSSSAGSSGLGRPFLILSLLGSTFSSSTYVKMICLFLVYRFIP